MSAPALTHATGLGGLNRNLLDNDGNVDHGRWLRASAEGGFVGECRTCGNYLQPHRPYDTHVAWYDAECINDTCHHQYAAPAGRTLRHSSRHGEMPNGWWDWRTNYLKRTREAA